MRISGTLIVLAGVVLTGCLKRDDSTAPSSGLSRVRVIHVSPTASALDVRRENDVLSTALGFATTSPATGYGSSVAGPGVLQVRDASGTSLYSAQAPLVRDSATTVVVLGNVGAEFAAGSARSFQPLVLKDTAATPTVGAWMRIVHAADSVAVSTTTAGLATSGVDIYVYPQGTPRPTAAPLAGAALRLINAQFRTVTGYLPLATAGTYQVDVFVTGAAPATAIPLFSAAVPLTTGSKTTVVARRAQVGATSAPLNAFGVVLLPEL
jgi:hypothetical protein